MKKIYHLYIDAENPTEEVEKIKELIKDYDYNFYNTEISIID